MAPDQVYRLELEERLRRLNRIGVALSAERNLNLLLDRILHEARASTGADAGTLYLLNDDHLTFEIAQNDSLGQGSGCTGQLEMPPVPLNRDTVSGYAAVTGEILNIRDVYAETGAPFEGPKHYDKITGYRTTSMLVVPMKDHEDQVTGVLQLLNAAPFGGDNACAFSVDDQLLIQSLASQAAVAINNVRLIEQTEQLFEAFVQVMATAIDERSPYTGGHIRRVMELSMVVAQAVNECREGPLASVELSQTELDELRIAAWMHDIGKITTPEWLVDKPTKLTRVYDRIELVRTRLELFGQRLQTQMLERKIAAMEAGAVWHPEGTTQFRRQLDQLEDDIAFLTRINQPGETMEDDDLARLKCIADRKSVDGESYLSDDEVENLSIRRGSLTEAEREKINDHAALSIKMLGQIPFTHTLQQVPAIAGAHHEKLDGSGYPQGLTGNQINLQARILGLVDIFESLSADDRPYRTRPIPREVVLRILQESVDANHLDRDIFDLFLKGRLYDELDRIKSLAAE